MQESHMPHRRCHTAVYLNQETRHQLATGILIIVPTTFRPGFEQAHAWQMSHYGNDIKHSRYTSRMAVECWSHPYTLNPKTLNPKTLNPKPQIPT